MKPAIATKNLTKEFGRNRAVASISLEIKQGEIFGLLGPNGAGKTTTISMLSTLIQPTSGSAQVSGFGLERQDEIRKAIGIVFQDPSLDDELTGKENLDFHGRLYHMPSQLRAIRISAVLKLVGLEDKAGQQVKTYSGGMKRRLEIARGLMHHPKILFLDEPTLGLDPQTRRGIWDYISKLNQREKVTIILTTHYMEEADALCDRIAIIDRGKIIALGTPTSLKDSLGGDVLVIEAIEVEKLASLLNGTGKTKITAGQLSVTVHNGERMAPKLLAIAAKHKIKITSLSLKKPTLEDVFIRHTGRTIREEEASPLDMMRVRRRAR
ncbi:MAG: ATP-binding cassette domain-containing protein [Candidatus Aenigmarchaeota archaeon]|nr:ATP-binding cassette domain-containing protein [Candidatus Aenigmarchaeota archaeon]